MIAELAVVRPVLVGLVGVFALTACTTTAADDQARQQADPPAETVSPEPTPEPEPEPEPEPDVDDPTGEDADPQRQTGMHGPPPGHDPDCAASTASSPGAYLTFPDPADPTTHDAGPAPVEVTVVGCSDTFEANVNYDFFHGTDTQPTLSGHTTGGTLGNWDEFTFTETLGTPGDWTIVVFQNDPNTGQRVVYDQVAITVS